MYRLYKHADGSGTVYVSPPCGSTLAVATIEQLDTPAPLVYFHGTVGLQVVENTGRLVREYVENLGFIVLT